MKKIPFRDLLRLNRYAVGLVRVACLPDSTETDADLAFEVLVRSFKQVKGYLTYIAVHDCVNRVPERAWAHLSRMRRLNANCARRLLSLRRW